MSEYVFDFYKFEEPDLSTGLREGIVRCRDCSNALDDITGTRLLCKHFSMEDDKRVLYPVMSEDGFCAWGKQRKRACQNADEEPGASFSEFFGIFADDRPRASTHETRM